MTMWDMIHTTVDILSKNPEAFIYGKQEGQKRQVHYVSYTAPIIGSMENFQTVLKKTTKYGRTRVDCSSV